MDGLVTAEWLTTHLRDPDLVLLDCSVDAVEDDQGEIQYHSGQKTYAQGHIPCAVFADLVEDLSDQQSSMLFALPSPEIFRNEMAKLGVGSGKKVVLYDRSFTGWATRVWWMLRWIGFDTAYILDGGQKAWCAAGGTLSTDPVAPSPSQLPLNVRADAMADQAEIGTSLVSRTCSLVDTLDADSFEGKTSSYGRPGHISGAKNASALDLFAPDGRFKPAAELTDMLRSDPAKRQITYCGAGILASVNAFVLVQLGYPDVGLYAASLQEWAANPDNPMDAS